MGYYTNFEIRMYDTTKNKAQMSFCDAGFGETIFKNFNEIVGYSFDVTPTGDYIYSSDEIKWYDHEAEMKQLSKLYPTVLFQVDGDGEEQGDVWVEYFIDGRSQYIKAEITLDDFDPSQLM